MRLNRVADSQKNPLNSVHLSHFRWDMAPRNGCERATLVQCFMIQMSYCTDLRLGTETVLTLRGQIGSAA